MEFKVSYIFRVNNYCANKLTYLIIKNREDFK